MLITCSGATLAGGADHRSSRRRAAVGESRDAEVEDLRLPPPEHAHVARLDVEVEDQAIVGVAEPLRDLDQELELAPRRQPNAMSDQVGEVFALQVLLHQVRTDRIEPEVEGADDRGMIEVAGDLGFTQELLAQLRVVGRAP